MKYENLNHKLFIKVPVADNKDLCYISCYVYGYILKKGFIADSNLLSENLEISINKIKKILKLLKEKDLIFIEDKRIYSKKENQQKYFLYYDKELSYDVTFLPNLDYLNLIDNAIYWKLYKYSDPVEGMNNCYTIGSKTNLKKIEENYITKILNISANALKQSIKKLKRLKLIKVKREGTGFYFGIQPITIDMEDFWRNQDFSYESKNFKQKEILQIYANYAKFYIKEVE